MLNPELKKDIEVEISKSEALIQEFLNGNYFRETLDLVFKVNRLNEIQKESVELETILYILNLSNYEEIGEAIKTECSIETASTAKQLSEDLEKYIFSKLKEKQLAKIEEEDGLAVKKIDLVKAEIISITGENKLKESVEMSIPADTHKLKNLLDENFDIKNPRDLVKNIITPENKNIVPSGITLDINSNSKENMKEGAEKIETKLGDVYRERFDLDEEIIKKEI